MPYFDPDSSERKKFKMFADQKQHSVAYIATKTTIQLFIIFFVLRVAMIGSGFAFFHVPVFDDMCWHTATYVQEYLKEYQK